MIGRFVISAIATLCCATPPAYADGDVTLEGIRVSCASSQCSDADAVIFVHGIYGDADTFKNGTFDWPHELPPKIRDRPIDVYRLSYQSALVAWGRKANPQFDDISDQIVVSLAPLRRKQYRSIGFIAHSLGGNIIAAYLSALKAEYGHPQRSQNAFLITLGTPRQGAQIANITAFIKDVMRISDDLLESLKDNNLYLRMARGLTNKANQKSIRYGCRPTLYYVGYETRGVGPITIVPSTSAADANVLNEARDVRAFDTDHIKISKPAGRESDVYRWVNDSIDDAFNMVDHWPLPDLCKDIPFVAEGRGTSVSGIEEFMRPKELP